METLPLTHKVGLISMTLHDLIALMNISIGTSEQNEIQYMKYTSEYILKLQIHQQREETENPSMKMGTYRWMNPLQCL